MPQSDTSPSVKPSKPAPKPPRAKKSHLPTEREYREQFSKFFTESRFNQIIECLFDQACEGNLKAIEQILKVTRLTDPNSESMFQIEARKRHRVNTDKLLENYAESPLEED